MIHDLTTSEFDTFLETDQIVLIVFSADWCEPCKAFKKVLEETVPLYPQVHFGLVNIEQEPELSSDFGVRSVPTVMIFREHVALCMESGALTKKALRDLLDQADSLNMDEVHQSIAQQFLGE